MSNVEQTLLYRKVLGCMLGGAIGDALGGPVEGKHWTPELIRETHGVVDRFVPYQREPGYHAHCSAKPLLKPTGCLALEILAMCWPGPITTPLMNCTKD